MAALIGLNWTLMVPLAGIALIAWLLAKIYELLLRICVLLETK
jgi:hypothetical protein